MTLLILIRPAKIKRSTNRFWVLAILCPIVSQVKYWRNHEDSEGEAQQVVVPSSENHTRLEGMKANSNYLIEVQGYNSAGYGPPSEHLQIRTKKARMLCFKAIQY